MANLKRIARKNNAVITDDPDGLLATLQVTKRLLVESLKAGEGITIMTALEKALELAAPKDQVRTWWKATRVLLRNSAIEKSTVAIVTDAIAGQGTTNRYIKKRIPA